MKFIVRIFFSAAPLLSCALMLSNAKELLDFAELIDLDTLTQDEQEYSAQAANDEIIVDDLINEERISELIGDNPNEITSGGQAVTCDQLTADELLTFIVEALPQTNILDILQHNFYKSTRKIIVRDVLDLISLKPDYFNCCGRVTNFFKGDRQFYAQPFYNQISRVYLRNNSPFITSILNIKNPVILRQIAIVLEDLNSILPKPIDINVPEIIALFKNFRVQERRAGGMFSYAHRYKNIFFSFRIPLYYLEHNFFLSNKERARIENHPLFRAEGIALHSSAGNPNKHIESMLQKILVNDRVGLGDMRTKLLFNIADNCYINAWLGIQATLPTAVDFKVGIFGSRFKTNACAPFFELKSFVNLFLCDMLEKIQEMGTQFGFEALRRLSTILINIPLGNDKHLGVGPYFEAKSFIDNYWSMRTSLRFDHFLPKRHKRFFLAAKNPQDFQLDLTDEDQADQNLAFIDKQINNTVFPFPVCVDVFPGHVIQVNHAFLFDTPCWHIGVGLDFWYKSKEVLGLQTGNVIGIFPKNIFKASQPHAYQGKIFSEIGYNGITKYKNICWQVLLAADVTVFSKDMGKDFTLGVRIGIDF